MQLSLRGLILSALYGSVEKVQEKAKQKVQMECIDTEPPFPAAPWKLWGGAAEVKANCVQ